MAQRLLLLLLTYLAAGALATATGQILPAACTPAGSAPPGCTKGNACNALAKGCCISAVSGSSTNPEGCSGCPYCCRVQNPPFSKQCALNTVLILDNTGSLLPYCSSVVPAVASFVNGLNNIVNAGGSVNLGVLLFQDAPAVVWDMTAVTATFLNTVQSWIGTYSGSGKTGVSTGTTVTAVFPTGSGTFPSGGKIPPYCTNTGTTNWAAALYLAAQWNWHGVPVPDIYIWFTDGFPEASGSDWPQTVCSANCYSNSNTFFSDICTTSAPCTLGCGTGVSCVTDSKSRPNNAEGTWASCPAADALKATGAKLFLVGVGLVQGHENEIQLTTGTHAWDGTPANFGTSDYIIDAAFSSLSQLFLETILGLCACLQAQPACSAVGNSCNATQFTAITRITTTAADTSTTVPPLSILAAKVYYNYLPSPNTQIAWAYYNTTQSVTTASPTIVRTDLQLPCAVQRQITCSGGGCVQITETKLIPRFFHESTDTPGCTAVPFTVTPQPAGLSTCTCYTKHYASPPFGAQVPEMIQYIWVYTTDSTTPCAAQAFDGTFYEFFQDAGVTYGVNGLGSAPTFPVSQSSSCTAPQCASNVELVFVLDQQSACTNADWDAINYFTLGVIGSFPVNAATRFGVVYAGSATGTWPTTSLQSTSVATWENYLGCPASGSGYGTTCGTVKNPAHIPIGGTSTDFASAIDLALTTFWSGAATGVKRELLTYVCGPSSSSEAALATMKTNLANANVEHWAIGVDQGSTSVTTLAALSSTNNYVHYIAVPLSAALPDQQILEDQLLCPQTSLCGVNCQGFCSCSSPSSPFNCSCPTCDSTFCNPASCPNPSAGCGSTNHICATDSCHTSVCNVNTQMCVPSAITCNDGNVCTTDTCNPATGCVYTPITCNDNNACTTDTCTAPTTGCTYTPKPACNDNNVCTTDSCSPTSGCVYAPITCNDNNACTTDSCNSTSGCKYLAITCNDNNACTADSCNMATGCVYTTINCNDNSACTTDSCNTTTGCVYTTINCNDNSACTTDSCSTSTGCVYTPITCNDGLVCTNDTCNAGTGCVYSPITGCTLCGTTNTCPTTVPPCTVKNCIEADTPAGIAAAQAQCVAITNYAAGYSSSACETAVSNNTHGNAAYCFLQNVSTTLCPSTACIPNSCNATSGQCNPQPITCNDNNACTTDSCNAGICVYTPSVVCSPDSCHTNACVPATGQCNPQPITCNDGSACTTDSCSTSGCVYTPITCDDGSACTTDTCSSVTGCVYTPITCDDSNLCTVDTCNTTTGCVYTQIVCNGDNCNTNSCNGTTGQCSPVPIICNDGVACTTDTCSLATGCVYTPVVCQQPATCFKTNCMDDGHGNPICVTSTTETPCVEQGTLCTSIVCRQGVGCVPVNKTCSATTECNFPAGCDNTNGDCILVNITSLIDFCGVCLGDDASCFFSSVYPVSNIGGIAGGVVAAIVIACIIAALLAFWLTKKGYDYYKAQGDLSSQGLHDNPAFQENNMSGHMHG